MVAVGLPMAGTALYTRHLKPLFLTANQDLVQLLQYYEQVLSRRKEARQQQLDIQNYF